MNWLFKVLYKIRKYIGDFSDKGFELRIIDKNPEKVFLVTAMWIGKIGWHEGISKNIVRCYPLGFSFWRGQLNDNKEWYCAYDLVVDFKQPLKIKIASPILTIKFNDNFTDCMLGEAASYIKEAFLAYQVQERSATGSPSDR